MACCSDGACPMHASGSHEASSARAVSQADADGCCAASERDDSVPSSSAIVLFAPLALTLSPVPPVLPEVLSVPDAWRTLVPVPRAHVPKHLLLSVLVV
jgi:hypothetical protein